MGSGANHRLRIASLGTAANIGGMERDFQSPRTESSSGPRPSVQITGPQSPKSTRLTFEVDVV
jgi:hypothetical protein